jgi:hypothetical protein
MKPWQSKLAIKSGLRKRHWRTANREEYLIVDGGKLAGVYSVSGATSPGSSGR